MQHLENEDEMTEENTIKTFKQFLNESNEPEPENKYEEQVLERIKNAKPVPIKNSELYCCQFAFRNGYMDIRISDLYIIQGKDIMSYYKKYSDYVAFKICRIEDGKLKKMQTVFYDPYTDEIKSARNIDFGFPDYQIIKKYLKK